MTKRDTYQAITDRIIELLERGTIPWRQPWTPELQPRNLVSGQVYRGINQWLLLAVQSEHTSPYWLTYRQAKGLGGHVRKGEHGTPVVLWRVVKRTKVDETTGEEVEDAYPMLRQYTVFNADQCELPPGRVPIVEPTGTVDDIEAAEAIIDGMPNPPRIRRGAGGAHYRPTEDLVDLPVAEYFISAPRHYSTAFHELGHATGHESRLSRPGVTQAHGRRSRAYAQEELVAEMTAAYLCGLCGIEPETLEDSAAYVASWLRHLRDDHRMIVIAAAQAAKAADYIIGERGQEMEDAA